MTVERPLPRQVDSPAAAEALAADWMRYLGFTDARVTATGVDGGIDVFAQHGLAQVKTRASPTGAPALRELYGARGQQTAKRLMFFSASPYSKPAIDFATSHEIALFVYDWFGDVKPANRLAHMMMHAASKTPQRTGVIVDEGTGETTHALPPRPSREWGGYRSCLGCLLILVVFEALVIGVVLLVDYLGSRF